MAPITSIRRQPRPRCDVAIIGAGPYGLSAAAHLCATGVLDVRVFGEPMSFWAHQMPAGMLLRTVWSASGLSDPDGTCTLDRFRDREAPWFGEPVPLERFVDYGRWFQRSLVPGVERRPVRQVRTAPGGFVVEPWDGEPLWARRVVVAAGVAPFAWRPPECAHLPPELASHTVDHRDLSSFAGWRVVVVGGGQSALESAALLHESGAEVELVMRQRAIRWLTRPERTSRALGGMLSSWPDLGPPGVDHVVARPTVYRRLPRQVGRRLGLRAMRPAAARGLENRLAKVTVRAGVHLVDVRRRSRRVTLRLDDGSTRTADHVLLATGFRVDVARYDFLAPQLVAAVLRVNGFPRLTNGFESSVAGLHFLGASASWSHGPLMEYVAGAGFASASLTGAILADRDGTRAAARRRVGPRASEPIPAHHAHPGARRR
jgi:FAD-dependent urate hydroxylase